MQSKESPVGETKTGKKQKTVKCVVVSDKANKSRVGEIVRLVKHKVAKKYIKRTSRIMFHDETNQTKVGDSVLIAEVRPISSKKSFTLLSILKNA